MKAVKYLSKYIYKGSDRATMEISGRVQNKIKVYLCYESPKQEKVSHIFEHLIQNLKAYNGVRI